MRRSTETMSAAQLRELESDIRAELARIERSLATEETNDAMLSIEGTKLRVAAASDSDASLTATLTDRVHARFLEVTEALRRIEDGRYGVCGQCGDGIAYGRLLAMPEATTCRECR